MDIHKPPKDAEFVEKTNEQSEVVHAVPVKTYTQEEVQAMLEAVQKGEK